MIQEDNMNWFSWYFSNRNRWLTAFRYLPRDMLLKTILPSFPIEFLINTAKSVKGKKVRLRLQLRITAYLLRNFRREIKNRGKHSKKLNKLSGMIIRIPCPIVKEHHIANAVLSNVLMKQLQSVYDVS